MTAVITTVLQTIKARNDELGKWAGTWAKLRSDVYNTSISTGGQNKYGDVFISHGH